MLTFLLVQGRGPGPQPTPTRTCGFTAAPSAAVLFGLVLLAGPLPALAAPPVLVTLEQALTTAAQRSESFAIADEQLAQARLARDRAWAAFLPNLSATGTFTHSDREIVRSFSGQDVVFQKQNAFAASVSGALVLLNPAAVPEILRAYRAAAAAKQDNLWNRAELAFEVARSYFAALAAENLVAAAERTLQSTQELLAAAQARQQAGEALRVDVTRARIEVVKAQGGLLRAKNTLASSLDLLATLIGREPPIAIQRPAALPVEGAIAQPEKDALGRPDLQAAELRRQAARRAVAAAWLDYLPTLSLVGSYYATQNTGFSGDPDSWNLLLQLDWLLFDGGLRRATRLQRSSEARQRGLEKQLLARDARRGVRQAHRDLKTARSNLTTAQEQLQLARQNRELVLARYQAGLGTSLELTEAEDELQQAEVAVVAEELNLALAALELFKTLGLDPRGRTMGG